MQATDRAYISLNTRVSPHVTRTHAGTHAHTHTRVHAHAHKHAHIHTHHPPIHLLLSSENTKEVRRCRPFRLVLHCWWSRLTETLVVVKPLLMECLVAVLTLDHLYGEVTLSLMVGQTCLIPSLKSSQDVCSVEHYQRQQDAVVIVASAHLCIPFLCLLLACCKALLWV